MPSAPISRTKSPAGAPLTAHAGFRRSRFRKRRAQTGSILVYLLFALVGVAIIGVAVIKLADTAGRVSHRSDQKMQANALAETAIQQIWAQNCASMQSSATPVTSLATTTLTSTVGSTTQTVGTYYATSAVYGTPVVSGNNTTYTYVIDGYGTTTGTALAGSTSHMRAYCVGTLTSTTSSGSGSGTSFGTGAIQVNGLLTITTDGQVRTSDASSTNSASMVANGGVSWYTSSAGNRNSNANSNYLQLAGQIIVPSATLNAAAWNLTNSVSTGVFKYYNNTATKVFQTPADSTKNIAQNTLQSESSYAPFPSATQVATWDATWKAQAQAGTTYSAISFNNGSGSDSALRNSQTGEYRITAPAYINGNLTVNSGQLYLMANSDTTKSNVVYVTGNVSNYALLYNRGVKLVVLGSYTDQSSGQYSLQTQYSPYSMTQLYAVTALISEQASASAITIGTNASSDMGLVYAANGGMVINSAKNMNGALVAGGVGSLGNVTINDASGGFGVNYYAAAVTGRTGDFPVTATVASNYFTTTKTPLYSWVQIQ